MADPPMATDAPAVTANPAARPASAGHWRRHSGLGWRLARSTTASASPSPTRAIVTLTANPRPTSPPASAALLAGGTIPPGPPPPSFPGGPIPPAPPRGAPPAPPHPPPPPRRAAPPPRRAAHHAAS